MKTVFLIFISSSFLLGFCPSCLAQIITVRVIDVANGRPLQRQKVSVSLLYDKGEQTPPKYDATLNLETNVNGEVQFTIPEPAPMHLSAQVYLTSEHWRCGCTVFGTTQDVIQKGLASPQPGSASKKADVTTKASEILFLARPLTFFERLLYPLVKG